MTPAERTEERTEEQTGADAGEHAGEQREAGGGAAVARRRRRRKRGPGDITDSRLAAAEMLADLRSGQLLDAAFERHAAPLDARDRRWVQELVWGTLRRRAWLDAVLSPRIRGGIARLDRDVTDLLRLGAYQLLAMGSVPPYAAIAQTVELAKLRHGLGASRLVNAVLRRLDRERDAAEPALPSDPVDALALRASHPRWLVDRWVERYGLAETERLLTVHNTEPPIVVRPVGLVREQLEATLEAAGVEVHDAPLVADSLVLGPGVQLARLGAFTQGLFTVQDPAATLVARYAAFPAGARVGDLCAAPGGKTVELARTARVVVAADRVAGRLERLLTTLGRLDLDNVVALVADARDVAVTGLDAVLVDVPCTGTGTLRRHPDARWRLKPSDLAVMAALQREILDAAASAVRPGGLLVYSTCSLEPEENDAVVDAFLAAHPAFTPEPPPAGSVPPETLDDGRLRVLPQRHGADGAFAARLRRADG